MRLDQGSTHNGPPLSSFLRIWPPEYCDYLWVWPGGKFVLSIYGALSFKLAPLARLAPGEYALGEGYTGEAFGDAYAFGIDGPTPSGAAK
jgi:hypothetical protein